MKGYGWFLITMAVLLMLIPLPALSVASDDGAPDPPTSTTIQSAPTAPSDTTEAEGVLRVLCGEEVVTLSEEEFLIRTLAMEMGPSYHEEALKAQAVAAYTYYARRREAQAEKADPALMGADFVTPNAAFPDEYTEEKLRLRWGDQYDENRQKLAATVAAERGIALVHDGKLIDACYHAISNGSTESAEVVWGADIPYLQAVASPSDRLSAGYASEVTLSAEKVRELLATELPDAVLGEDPATWFGQPILSDGGTVAQQPIGDTQLAGTRVRQLFGLRSAAFAVTYAEGQFTFAVQGYGHGVGMSQYGADYLARQGYTYDEILRYYYTDVTIQAAK